MCAERIEPVAGPRFDGTGTRFSVRSEHATRVELWLFDAPADELPTARLAMERDGALWTLRVEGVGPGSLYGFRAWGPNWSYSSSWTPGSAVGFHAHVDAEGNRFNPNKLLLDPYGRAISGDVLRAYEPDTGTTRTSHTVLGGNDAVAFLDSAAAMPKSVVVDERFDWEGVERPRTAVKDTLVYETHLRGFTRADPAVSEALRGSYGGLSEKVDYLKRLGVTAVELLPLHEFSRYDDPIYSRGEREERLNYWGYMSVCFFAPNWSYSATAEGGAVRPGACVRELKSLVKALHAAGIEVWMDVVYNHTGEGGMAPDETVRYLSLRGLDNQEYYTLADDRAHFWESTGTGNNLNAARPAVQRLILDSLRYWIEAFQIDGFRFDLAYTLGRTGEDGRVFEPEGPLLTAIAALGAETGVKMVAEAWDTSGFGVGAFPKGWMEWNGLWRDNVRRFVKGDPGQVAALARSVGASWEGLSPATSVNFVTAHDGFTLNDLVSYDFKRNGLGDCNPLGLDPHSGADNNYSWGCGGDEPLRRQQLRNFAAQLFLHQGVPMILAGDEFRNSQRGNNNAYMADNPCGWLNWADLEQNFEVFEFFRRMIGLRRRHAALGRVAPLLGADPEGAEDIRWHGKQPGHPDWSGETRLLAFTLSGRSAHTGAAADAPDLYVAMNAHWVGQDVCLPPPPPGQRWWLTVDTARWAEPARNIFFEPAIFSWDAQPMLALGRYYHLQPRSTLVAMARPLGARRCELKRWVLSGAPTQPGDTAMVVGELAELGGWQPEHAKPLAWEDGRWAAAHPVWTQLGGSLRYRYLVKKAGGEVVWERGPARQLPPSRVVGELQDSWQG